MKHLVYDRYPLGNKRFNWRQKNYGRQYEAKDVVATKDTLCGYLAGLSHR